MRALASPGEKSEFICTRRRRPAAKGQLCSNNTATCPRSRVASELLVRAESLFRPGVCSRVAGNFLFQTSDLTHWLLNSSRRARYFFPKFWDTFSSIFQLDTAARAAGGGGLNSRHCCLSAMMFLVGIFLKVECGHRINGNYFALSPLRAW